MSAPSRRSGHSRRKRVIDDNTARCCCPIFITVQYEVRYDLYAISNRARSVRCTVRSADYCFGRL